MRPEAYLRPLLARWWAVLLAALVAGAVGYLSQVGQPATYEASTRLIVTAQPPEYFADQLAANFTQVAEPLVRGPNAVDTAVMRGYLPPEDAAYAYRVVTRSNRDNRTVALALTDTDPARSARVVGALARVAVEKNAAERAKIADQDRQDSTGAVNGMQNSKRTGVLLITSLDCATASADLTSGDVRPDCPAPPTTANGPRTRLTAIAATLIGAVFGTILMLALAALDDSLRGRDDVRRYLDGLPVVATIPRAGVTSNR